GGPERQLRSGPAQALWLSRLPGAGAKLATLRLRGQRQPGNGCRPPGPVVAAATEANVARRERREEARRKSTPSVSENSVRLSGKVPVWRLTASRASAIPGSRSRKCASRSAFNGYRVKNSTCQRSRESCQRQSIRPLTRKGAASSSVSLTEYSVSRSS